MYIKHKSLSFKQTLSAVAAAFSIGLLAAMVQLYFAFQEAESTLESNMTLILKVTQRNAEQAVYDFDEAAANQVLIGLFEYPSIYQVKITENFGSVLAQGSREPITGDLGWLFNFFFKGQKYYNIVLHHSGKQGDVGSLQMMVSSYPVAMAWFAQSKKVLLSTVIQSFFLALVLLFLFYRSITRPLLDIIDSLAQLDFKKLTNERLSTPIHHEKDELGFLVHSTNTLLRTIHDDAEMMLIAAEETKRANKILELEVVERQQAEVALIDAHRTLEERVVERTQELTAEIKIREKTEIALKVAKNEAERANKAKSSFLANMSHEIRTPLNSILGFSQLLGHDELLPGKLKPTVKTIERSGTHLLELINDILDFSKIEAGVMTLQNQDFGLSVLVEGISDMFSLHCLESKVVWRLESDISHVGAVRGDQRKIRQVLLNLIGNAVKFTEAGDVSLHVSRLEDDRYCFKIQDSGPGIPISEQQNVYTAFQQTDVGKDKGGTGLGLAICQRLLSLMDSQLNLKSEEGKGSCFSFCIQLPPAQSIILPRESRGNFPQITLLANTQLNALVVDDIKENRTLLTQVLQDIGVDVYQASNGQEALDRLAKQQIDVIFLDIRMPIMGGYETIKRIHQQYGEQAPKCIAVTASVLNMSHTRFKEKGFDDVIIKPFRVQAVFTQLKKYLPQKFDLEPSPDSHHVSKLEANEFRVSIPLKLRDDLLNAAKLYQLTHLNELAAELKSLGQEEEQLAEHLSKLIQDFQMGKITDLVSGLDAGNQEN